MSVAATTQQIQVRSYDGVEVRREMPRRDLLRVDKARDLLGYAPHVRQSHPGLVIVRRAGALSARDDDHCTPTTLVEVLVAGGPGAIADLRREGLGVRQIAVEIGRPPSTVSRELRRNVDEEGRYGPHAAQRKSDARMPRPRPRRVSTDPVLHAAVCELLTKRWSSEQVAHELTVRFGDQQRRLCPESIYQPPAGRVGGHPYRSAV